MGTPKIPESIITQAWQSLWGRELATRQGNYIQIVYPGRASGNSGPDFHDAVIATEGGRLAKGDIEIHVKSSQWRAHGHHLDPGYNRVILHVVMWDDSRMPTTLQNGEIAPVLALDDYLKGQVEEVCRWASQPALSTEPCHGVIDKFGAKTTGQLLDAAGEERFRAKVALFEKGLTSEEAGQVLYQGVMGALGYTKNKKPFQELARRLPLCILESSAPSKIEASPAMQQALLLGTAGLLPSQRRGKGKEEKWVTELEEQWHYWGKAGAMTEASWHFIGVRPYNFPTRRIAAASYLLARYREKGLLEGALHLLKKAHQNGNRRLEEGLIASDHGYWAEHFDFGVRGATNSALLGRDRAAELAVNVILPFAIAWGKSDSQPELMRMSYQLYRSYPRLAENGVTHHMTKQIFPQGGHRAINSARRQQGLIHIYECLCTEGRCNACPLGC